MCRLSRFFLPIALSCSFEKTKIPSLKNPFEFENTPLLNYAYALTLSSKMSEMPREELKERPNYTKHLLRRTTRLLHSETLEIF